MIAETWVWLIGMSDADDERLLSWARSFSHPPLLELFGAHPDSEPNCPERRALRLIVDERTVTLTIHPQPICVNPVFELSNVFRDAAPGRAIRHSTGCRAVCVGRTDAVARCIAYGTDGAAPRIRTRAAVRNHRGVGNRKSLAGYPLQHVVRSFGTRWKRRRSVLRHRHARPAACVAAAHCSRNPSSRWRAFEAG